VIEPGVFFEGSCRMEFTDADEARLRVDAARKGLREDEPDEDDQEQGDLVRSLSN
jgi:hypothetical protein